jgi:5-methylcytosine-specific restriction endonuclease McrA
MTTVAEAIAAIVDRPKPEPRYATKAKRFRASAAWRAARYKALAANARRNGGIARCELCGRSRADGAVMHVDHIEPLSKNWARRLDPTNHQICCADCNMGKGNKDSTDFRPTEVQREQEIAA